MPPAKITLLAAIALAGCPGSAPRSPPPPGGPYGVLASAGDAQVTVTWPEVPGADTYNLYWAHDGQVGPATGNLIAGVTSPYVHGGLPGGLPTSSGTPGSLINGQMYCYVLTAVKGAVEGSPGGAACTQPYFPVVRPGVPTELLVLVAMPEGAHDIHLFDAGTRELRNLTQTPDVDEGKPAWSPDGERIAFHSDRDGGGLFIMEGDGSNLTRVADDGFDPAWSPDGQRLVVQVAGGLRTMLTDGTDLFQVTDGTSAMDGSPAWSPDGSLIAFDAGSVDSSSYFIRPDGTGRRPGPPGKTPAWSHDGLQIASICRMGIGLGSLRVCVFDLGGIPKANFGSDGRPGNPSWSADGRIAFDIGPAGGGQGTVLVAFPNPAPPSYFVQDLLASAASPRWRPRMSAIPGPGEVTIRWAPSAGATSYNLYFGTSPGVTTASGTRVEGVVSPYLHAGLAAGSTFHYVVTALNSGRETEASPEVFATVPIPPP